MVQMPWEYFWSSAAAHLDCVDHAGLLDMGFWRQISSNTDWRSKLLSNLEPEHIEQIRRNTHTGRPLASDSLMSKIEKVLHKRLRPLPKGRPRKETAENR